MRARTPVRHDDDGEIAEHGVEYAGADNHHGTHVQRFPRAVCIQPAAREADDELLRCEALPRPLHGLARLVPVKVGAAAGVRAQFGQDLRALVAMVAALAEVPKKRSNAKIVLLSF